MDLPNLDVLSTSMMVFIVIAIIGVIMAVKTKYRRNQVSNMLADDKLRDVLADEKKMMDRHRRPEPESKRLDWSQNPEPKWGGEQFGKPKIDELIKDLKDDVEKEEKNNE